MATPIRPHWLLEASNIDRVNIKAQTTILTDEVTSAESLGSDFIRNRLASQYSQRIVNHAFYHPLTGIHGVSTNMGGDDHIRKAE